MTIAAGRAQASGAGQSLVGLSRDTTHQRDHPRHGGDALLRNPSQYMVTAIQMALGDRDPLLRRAAAEQLESIDPAMRAPMATAAAGRLGAHRPPGRPAGASPGCRTPAGPTRSERPSRGSSPSIAPRRSSTPIGPSRGSNLGSLDARLGRTDVAETEFRHAIALQPQFVPAYMQLAELYRTTQQEQQADSVLRMGLDRVPGNIDLQYQLGLALVRQGKKADALPYLKAAAGSGSSHYVYVYAVALFDAGQSGPSISALQGALAKSPDDTELLYGLASIAAAAGKRERGALRRAPARGAGAGEPGDPAIRDPTRGRSAGAAVAAPGSQSLLGAGAGESVVAGWAGGFQGAARYATAAGRSGRKPW